MGHYRIHPNYEYTKRHFLNWLSRNGKSILDADAWKEYMVEVCKTYLKPASRNSHLAALKDTITHEIEMVADDISGREVLRLQNLRNELKSYRVPIKNPFGKSLSDEERTYLIEQIQLPNWGLPGNQNRKPRPDIALMMEFMWETGARVSAMTGTLLSEISSWNGTSRVRYIEKGKKIIEVEVPSDLIKRCKDRFNSKTYLFESPNGGKDKDNPCYRYQRTTVSQTINRMGWSVLHRKNISAHTFRYAQAHKVIGAAREVHAMQMKLGHASMGGTAHYAGGGE